jgi:acyl-CoA hydrolase
VILSVCGQMRKMVEDATRTHVAVRVTALDPETYIASIEDGMTVMIGGFGGAGAPIELIHALVDRYKRPARPAT